MPGNSFGRIFQLSTFGESHGPAIGVVIDGVPPNMSLAPQDIQKELDRRRPGQSSVTTPRKESDTAEILSGVFEGKTTGAPLAIMIRNTNQQSKDYSAIKDLYRPGHADFTYQQKYGIRDYRGGGRSSGRETACRVAAGAIAKKYLKDVLGVSITAYTSEVGGIKAETIDLSTIEDNVVRCPDPVQAKKMITLIESIHKEGDSIGGVVEACITGVPVGLGDPCFDKLDAVLSHAVMSIATIKGVEFGAGFAVSKMKGSENNDSFTIENDKVSTKTNHAGGLLGGISNGQDIVLRMAVKPPSSITKEQETVSNKGVKSPIQVHGRHDPCICPRVVPVVEAMIAIAILDSYLLQKTY